jgi:hypothetical protein
VRRFAGREACGESLVCGDEVGSCGHCLGL